MKNGARDCTLLRGRKREIKEGKTERLRKRESTVINECDTESVCEREREGDEWGLISPGWWNPVILYIHTPADGNIWRRVSVCGKKRCDVWLCLCEATKEVRDKSVCALASVRVTQMQPRKCFLGRKKMWLESSGIWFSLPLWKKCRRQQTRSRKGIKSCWWTKLSGAITPAGPTALSSSLCLFSQKAFSPPVQINRFLTNKRQWIHMYIQTDASNSL